MTVIAGLVKKSPGLMLPDTRTSGMCATVHALTGPWPDSPDLSLAPLTLPRNRVSWNLLCTVVNPLPLKKQTV